MSWSLLTRMTLDAKGAHFPGTTLTITWPSPASLGSGLPSAVSARVTSWTSSPVIPALHSFPQLLPHWLLLHFPKTLGKLGTLHLHSSPGVLFCHHVSASPGSLLKGPFLSGAIPGRHFEAAAALPRHRHRSPCAASLLFLLAVFHHLTC